MSMDAEHGAALTLKDVTVCYPDGTAPVSGVDLALALSLIHI